MMDMLALDEGNVIKMATTVQMGISIWTSLTRPDANGWLAMMGLVGATTRKKDVCVLYFILLCVSILPDIIWMIEYGYIIENMDVQLAADAGYYDDQYPRSTCNFVLSLASLQFILKVLSLPFAYKLQLGTFEPKFSAPSKDSYQTESEWDQA